MKKWLLASVLVLPLVFACTFACNVEKVVGEGLAPALTSVMGCPATATPVIQATITADLNVGNLCKVAEKCEANAEAKDMKKGVIASAICPVVAATAVAEMGNLLPQSWIDAGCKPAAGGLGAAVLTACNLLPF